MAHDLKYGRVTTEHGDIPDDEPVIILRGQDRLTVPTMSNYGFLAIVGGCDDVHVGAVEAAIDIVSDWQSTHVTKVPDTDPAEPGDGFTPDGWDRTGDRPEDDQAATDG